MCTGCSPTFRCGTEGSSLQARLFHARGEACTRLAQAALLADKLRAGQIEGAILRQQLAMMTENRDALALMVASMVESPIDDEVFCMEL